MVPTNYVWMAMTDEELRSCINSCLIDTWSMEEFITALEKRINTEAIKFEKEEREQRRLNHAHRHDLYDL